MTPFNNAPTGLAEMTMKSVLVLILLLSSLSSPVHAASGGYTRLPAVEFADASRFVLHGVAAEYVRQDYGTFRDATDVRELYRDGVIDAASFIIREARFGNIVGGSVLIFDSRHTAAVVGNIAPGAPMADVVRQFGPPGFSWEERGLVGYKTEHFYIAFTGSGKVERIYLSRRQPQRERIDILPALLEKDRAMRSAFSFEDWGMRSTQLWRGTLTWYRPDGLCIWSGEEDYPVYVHTDYEGRIPEAAEGGGVRILLSDSDYPEFKIYLALVEEEEIRKILTEEGVYSPGKRTAAVPYGNCTYERSGWLFRRLDGSEPDNFVTFGHFPAPPLWLNERYVGVETMHGFGVYDLSARPATNEDAVFYIEYHDAAGPFVWDFDAEQGTLLIPTEGFTISEKRGEKPVELELGEDEQLLLRFRYDHDGNLAVSYSAVKRDGR